MKRHTHDWRETGQLIGQGINGFLTIKLGEIVRCWNCDSLGLEVFYNGKLKIVEITKKGE